MRHLEPNHSRAGERTRAAGVSSQAGARWPEAESRAEAVLAALLESVECGILLAGPQGELWAVNDRFAESI